MINLLLYPALGFAFFALVLKLGGVSTKLAISAKYLCAMVSIAFTSNFFVYWMYPEIEEHFSSVKLTELMPLLYIICMAVFDYYMFKHSIYFTRFSQYLLSKLKQLKS